MPTYQPSHGRFSRCRMAAASPVSAAGPISLRGCQEVRFVVGGGGAGAAAAPRQQLHRPQSLGVSSKASSFGGAPAGRRLSSLEIASRPASDFPDQLRAAQLLLQRQAEDGGVPSGMAAPDGGGVPGEEAASAQQATSPWAEELRKLQGSPTFKRAMELQGVLKEELAPWANGEAALRGAGGGGVGPSAGAANAQQQQQQRPRRPMSAPRPGRAPVDRADGILGGRRPVPLGSNPKPLPPRGRVGAADVAALEEVHEGRRTELLAHVLVERERLLLEAQEAMRRAAQAPGVRRIVEDEEGNLWEEDFDPSGSEPPGSEAGGEGYLGGGGGTAGGAGARADPKRWERLVQEKRQLREELERTRLARQHEGWLCKEESVNKVVRKREQILSETQARVAEANLRRQEKLERYRKADRERLAESEARLESHRRREEEAATHCEERKAKLRELMSSASKMRQRIWAGNQANLEVERQMREETLAEKHEIMDEIVGERRRQVHEERRTQGRALQLRVAHEVTRQQVQRLERVRKLQAQEALDRLEKDPGLLPGKRRSDSSRSLGGSGPSGLLSSSGPIPHQGFRASAGSCPPNSRPPTMAPPLRESPVDTVQTLIQAPPRPPRLPTAEGYPAPAVGYPPPPRAEEAIHHPSEPFAPPDERKAAAPGEGPPRIGSSISPEAADFSHDDGTIVEGGGLLVSEPGLATINTKAATTDSAPVDSGGDLVLPSSELTATPALQQQHPQKAPQLGGFEQQQPEGDTLIRGMITPPPGQPGDPSCCSDSPKASGAAVTEAALEPLSPGTPRTVASSKPDEQDNTDPCSAAPLGLEQKPRLVVEGLESSVAGARKFVGDSKEDPSLILEDPAGGLSGSPPAVREDMHEPEAEALPVGP